MIDFFQQKILLQDFCLQRLFCTFQFSPLVQSAKVLQFRKKALAQIASRRLRIMQQALRQFLVDLQKLLGVVFQRQMRMNHRPIVRRANKGQVS